MTCFTHRDFDRHRLRNGQVAIHSKVGSWKDGVTSESEGDDAPVSDSLMENQGEIAGKKPNGGIEIEQYWIFTKDFLEKQGM